MAVAPVRPLLLALDASWYGYAGRAFFIAFLNLITFGIYKPYGITRIRRALYNNIYVGRDHLQYDGTARGLAKVTFYPALALFCLLMLPAIVQFFASWQTAVAIGGVQLLLLIFYADWLRGLDRQYEIDQLSWRGFSFSLDLPGAKQALRTNLSGWANRALLGALAPWRRVWLTRHLYAGLRFGRHTVSCVPELRPLLLPYYIGWALALTGWVVVSWYGWYEAVVPVKNLLSGGQADPAMAATLDPAMFAQPGLEGGGDSQTLAQMGTWLHAFTLAFLLIPAGLLWQQLCLSIYEWRWWQVFCDGLQLQTSRVRFDGSWWGLYWRGAVALFLNMMTANLTRPFTTFSRLRYFTTHLMITNPESLEKLLAPPVRS